MKNLNKQRGTAIIVALFITALVAAIAISMIDRLRIDTRRTSLVLNHNQAVLYAQGSIYWAMDQLIKDYKEQKPDKPTDSTPIKSTIDKINGAVVSSVIYDAQGKLNLNNLTDPQFQILFASLIHIVSPHVPKETVQMITLGVVDWITVGVHDSLYDQYYAKLQPAYRSAHQLMMSVSELRLIRGMTPELYMQLAPYVTALPEKTQFNINSIPIPVLMSFSPAVTLEMAKAIDLYRKQSPFTTATLSTLSNFAAIKNAPIAQSNLIVTSSYFLVQTRVTIGEQHLMMYTLMVRVLKNSQPTMMIVWQSKGTL